MTIKHETIEVSGTVVYCDGCGKRGPESAYDNINDTTEMAQMDGWEQTDDDLDLCADCVKEGREAKKPVKRRAW